MYNQKKMKTGFGIQQKGNVQSCWVGHRKNGLGILFEEAIAKKQQKPKKTTFQPVERYKRYFTELPAYTVKWRWKTFVFFKRKAVHMNIFYILQIAESRQTKKIV